MKLNALKFGMASALSISSIWIIRTSRLTIFLKVERNRGGFLKSERKVSLL